MTAVTTSDQFSWMNLGRRLILWITYSVIIALLPIASTFFVSLTTNSQVTLTDALSKGDLLLISVAISGGVVGDLIRQEAEGVAKYIKEVIIGLTLITIIASCIWFGNIASVLAEHRPVDAHAVSMGSQLVFWSSVLLGCVCVAISPSEER